jgi:hypothetical protein
MAEKRSINKRSGSNVDLELNFHARKASNSLTQRISTLRAPDVLKIRPAENLDLANVSLTVRAHRLRLK